MTTSLPPRTRGPKPTKVDPDHLLDAAQAVFAREGLHSASLRAIAREAGCDPALIYYHFANKEALFVALMDRRFPKVARDMGALAHGTDDWATSLRLWEVLRIFHRHLRNDPGLRSLIRGEIVRGAEGVTALIEARIRPVAEAVRAIVAQGMERGDLRTDLDPMLTTFFLLRMHLEILDVLPVILPRFTAVRADQAPEVGLKAWFQVFWRGVATDPARPLPALPDPELP